MKLTEITESKIGAVETRLRSLLANLQVDPYGCCNDNVPFCTCEIVEGVREIFREESTKDIYEFLKRKT